MKSAISMWKILPLIRGCKFLSEGLTPFLLMPCQHESPLVKNRPDNSAHTIINTTQLCLGRELFVLSFGEDLLLCFRVSASSILGKPRFPHLPCFRTSLVVQWLKICLPLQESPVWPLVGEPTCCRASKLAYHNWRDRALQLRPEAAK